MRKIRKMGCRMFRVIVLLSSQSASDYGLIDAPLQWWKCFTTCLTELGMRQSELDPCCFRYYHDHELHGVLALHVDDMVFGGHMFSWRNIVKKMREKFPFKHWITQRGEFLGRPLDKRMIFRL